MSSAATIEFEDDESFRVGADKWSVFCSEFGLEHSPRTVGGNVWYVGGFGGVECTYTPTRIVFSTLFGGEYIPDVARLAMEAWLRWGGDLHADLEIRDSIRDLILPEGKAATLPVTFYIQATVCPACGHQHAGPEVGGICIGCPCDRIEEGKR